MGMEEVLEANIPLDFKNFSAFLVTLAFNSLFSKTASMIRSQPFNLL